MATRPDIDIPTLRQSLAYDPETGKLTWLPRRPAMFANSLQVHVIKLQQLVYEMRQREIEREFGK